MKYKVGDKVRIKSLGWYNENKDEFGKIYYKVSFVKSMVSYCDSILTIEEVTKDCYLVKENSFYWTDEMIEGLVEEEDLIPKFGEYSDNEPLDIPTITTEFVKEHGLPCPNGYIFKDENGNVINATKIVLEKKKKGYPKTYEECCKIMGIHVRDLDILDNMLDTTEILYSKNLDRLLNAFRKLIICRDAYWKIAGEEMGLGKPWEPDFDNLSTNLEYIKIVKGCFTYSSRAFAFPTEEMRDAFYENFKEELEICKELL